MPFRFWTREERMKEEAAMPKRFAEEDLYLDRDRSKIVGEGPEAAFLLARKGREIPKQYHGLMEDKSLKGSTTKKKE